MKKYGVILGILVLLLATSCATVQVSPLYSGEIQPNSILKVAEDAAIFEFYFSADNFNPSIMQARVDKYLLDFTRGIGYKNYKIDDKASSVQVVQRKNGVKVFAAALAAGARGYTGDTSYHPVNTADTLIQLTLKVQFLP